MSEWFIEGDDTQPDANLFEIEGTTYNLSDIELIMWVNPSGDIVGHLDDGTNYDEFMGSPEWQVSFYNNSVITISREQRNSEVTESLLAVAFPD